MWKMAVRRAVQLDDMFHAQRFQDGRDGQAAYRVDAVDSYGEVALLYRLFVHQFQRQHILYVLWQIVLVRHMAQRIHFSKHKILFLGYRQHTLALGVVQKLTVLI